MPTFLFAFERKMKEEKLIEKVKAIIEPVLLEEGLELYDIEWHPAGRHSCLRIFIDKEGGVTIDDCKRVSSQIGDLLDVEDLIHTSYLLEVSSPGLTRELKKPLHFKKSIGKLAKIVLKEPLEGRQILKGKIIEADEEGLVLEEEKSLRISYNMVSGAKLELEEL